MNYTLEFLSGNGYVQARISGNTVFEAARECAIQMFALAAGSDCKKILLDCRRATTDVGISDIHGFSLQIEHLGCDRQMRVAIVFRSQAVNYQFLETVARNRGFDFRVFTELADAEAWLAGEPVASA